MVTSPKVQVGTGLVSSLRSLIVKAVSLGKTWMRVATTIAGWLATNVNAGDARTYKTTQTCDVNVTRTETICSDSDISSDSDDEQQQHQDVHVESNHVPEGVVSPLKTGDDDARIRVVVGNVDTNVPQCWTPDTNKNPPIRSPKSKSPLCVPDAEVDTEAAIRPMAPTPKRGGCPHNRIRNQCRELECRVKVNPRAGYTEKVVSTRATERKVTEKEISALPLRNPGFENPPDEKGCTLVNPSTTVLVQDKGMDMTCYYPALAMCTGQRNLFGREVRSVMRNPHAGELKQALIKHHDMELEKAAKYNTKPLELLKETSGMYMVVGKAGQHDHWVGFDAYRGVLYGGGGHCIVIDESDLVDKTTALNAFRNGINLDIIRQVYLLKNCAPGQGKQVAKSSMKRKR